MTDKTNNSESIKSSLLVELKDHLNIGNNKLNKKISELEKTLSQFIPKPNVNNSDLILSKKLKNLEEENRPQLSSDSLFNENFKDLSNHDLHRIKDYMDNIKSVKNKTILDETLGETINKTVNFLTFSFEGYTKAVYEAEVMEDVYDDDKSIYQSIKVYLIAIVLFMREDQNILYIGILLIFISMVMYLMNITTS